jgi:hypothetical protein
MAGPALAGGRLLATGGATPVEGGAGGGIVPWAVLAGSGTGDQWGGSAFATRLSTDDYQFSSRGLAVTAYNRVELSLARQDLRLDTLGPALGLRDPHLRLDVYGIKLRALGDLVYGAWPQLSIGAQYKRQRDFAVPALVGARDDSDIDYYLAASRLYLAGAAGYNLLLNATLRSTRANQGGLLGFGGDQGNARSWHPELAAVVLLRPELAFGVEWRDKPDQLGFAREDAWSDVFVGWFPNKHAALVLAYADLGSVAGLDAQRGWYLSLQLAP